MNFVFVLYDRVKGSGFLIAIISLFLYFTYFTICGNRSLPAYFRLKKEITQAQNISRNYKTEKERLENKVKRLSSNSLDVDMLDERARIVLSLAKDNEFVLFDASLDE